MRQNRIAHPVVAGKQREGGLRGKAYLSRAHPVISFSIKAPLPGSHHLIVFPILKSSGDWSTDEGGVLVSQSPLSSPISWRQSLQ